MELLYRDKEIVVCIKPIGVDSELLPKLYPEESLLTVHRLDKQVSGVMVYAKTKAAAANLSNQMQNHQFTKEYRAVVEGKLPMAAAAQAAGSSCAPAKTAQAAKQTAMPSTLPQGSWEDLLYHDKRKNKVFTVKKERKGVKYAALRYAVLAETEAARKPTATAAASPTVTSTATPAATSAAAISPAASHAVAISANPAATSATAAATTFSLLQIHLETGRTHQIRVQAASRKLPLVGDARYGSQNRSCDIALFSHKLCFNHPSTGEALCFCKEVPNTYPWNLF